MSISKVRRALLMGAALTILNSLLITPALAHEHRHVGGYEMVVGFIDEPVYTGQKSGLEFLVEDHDGQPVTGLAETLEAEVIYGDQRMDLPISPRWGADGWYQSIFFPTAAGSYTFRIHGTIAGDAVDESFTSGPDTFDEVEEQSAGHFPNILPTTAELAADAQRGADAGRLALLALGLGVTSLLLGLVALGLALATRRRAGTPR
ncbi:MAG TPA: hypothetical protein VM305_11265 [Candidatus Limnocylindrales bacterium]|nr:hypothetical protein [Candidatus Limnocylindrales bacterium]